MGSLYKDQIVSEFKRVKSLISLKEYASSKLEIAHGKFVCPFCDSGGHEYANSDSAFFIYENSQQFHCFGCGAHGDVFDLIAQIEDIPISNKVEQLNEAKRWLSEIMDSDFISKPFCGRPRFEMKTQEGTNRGKNNTAGYLKQSQTNIAKCAGYLEARGFSMDFAIEHGLGFDESRRALLIPYPGSEFYFIGRSIEPNARFRYFKPKASEVGGEPIFNETALDWKYAIATEGQIDCLSILSIGFNCLAVGGASNWKKVVEAAGKQDHKPTIFILFDRDPAGIKASRAFANALREKAISFEILTPPRKMRGKDPNEWLVNDKEAFSSFLASAVAEKGRLK